MALVTELFSIPVLLLSLLSLCFTYEVRVVVGKVGLAVGSAGRKDRASLHPPLYYKPLKVPVPPRRDLQH